MKTVAIAGVGLIGGSFGLALRKAGFSGEILGVSSQAAIEAGIRMGAITRSATLEEAAAEADLIYLAQPVDRILETLVALGPLARSGCLITDAGSTKTAIVRKAEECIRSASFVGGHPLAGKEQRGAEAADADLFRERIYVLTPSSAEAELLAMFQSWLERMGARIVKLSAEEHDAVLAFTSHLPQLVSTALAHTLADQNSAHVREIFGRGLLDMTRLALSSGALWESICETNKSEILAALGSFLGSVQKLRNALERGSLQEFFGEAAAYAREVRNAARIKSEEL